MGEVRGVDAECAAILIDSGHDLRAMGQRRGDATDATEQLEDRDFGDET